MGDVGDYWREHKEYTRDRKAADDLGLSLNQYRRRMKRLDAERKAEEKASKLAQHAIQCECGRTFLDVNAHNSHKSRWGKKGHKGSPIERPAKEPENDAIKRLAEGKP